MENNNEKRKIKLRLNLFDIIFIACAVIAAVLIVVFSNRTSGGVLNISGTQELVEYSIDLQDMRDDTAYLIKPGDTLIDKVEKRTLGTVVSVEVRPHKEPQRNLLTGERVISETPGRLDATVVVSALATVTESQISVDGLVIRVGTWISVNGPTYHSAGFIAGMKRDDNS